MSVADAERSQGIHAGHDGVVSGYEGLAVNTFCRKQAYCQTEQKGYEKIFFIHCFLFYIYVPQKLQISQIFFF
jgi:hypothetical protein